MDYSFYSFYWLDSLQIRLDHNSTYYRPLSKNSDVKPRISHCDSRNLQYKTHPEFWPSHRRIFKTSLYYKTRLILETRRYMFMFPLNNLARKELIKYNKFNVWTHITFSTKLTSEWLGHTGHLASWSWWCPDLSAAVSATWAHSSGALTVAVWTQMEGKSTEGFPNLLGLIMALVCGIAMLTTFSVCEGTVPKVCLDTCLLQG